MKKAIASALAAAFVLTAASSVFADPLEFNGKVQYQHRINNTVAGVDKIENRWKFVLNGKADTFASNMKFYFRIGAESLNGDSQSARDFNSFPGQGDDVWNAVGLFDQFGVEVQNAGWNYKIGRQDAFIGANGLIYDSTYAIGKHIFADGVTVTGKSGVTNIAATALQLDQYGSDDAKVYAVSASYNPSKDFTVGTTLAKYDTSASKLNFWDVNTSYVFSNKLDGYAEYAKSNAATSNKAYVYGLNYSVDSKNFLWACYSHVEVNGNIRDGWSTTTYDNNGKGMWYGYGHKFDKTTSLALFYSDMKKIDTDKKFTSFRTTINYKF